jgi:uncharacterized membrane protein
MGFMLTLTSYSFLMCLVTFFVTSSKVTKFRSERKRKTEEGFKEGEDITVFKVNFLFLVMRKKDKFL